MKVLDRRGFIKSAPIAALAVTAPVAAFQPPIAETPKLDPLRDWLNQWHLVRAECLDDGYDPDSNETSQGEALWKRMDALAEKLATTPARTQDGALAQIEWVLGDSENVAFLSRHREALELAVAEMNRGLV